MVAVLQRVKNASVTVDGNVVGCIQAGLTVLLGVAAGDTEEDAELLASKIVKLRIFTDENGKMNYSLADIGGGMLIVSNFTLMADYRHGNRPDYLRSAQPEAAKALYNYFVEFASQKIEKVSTGMFGAHMEIQAVCDGPVTIVMDSEVLKNKMKG